MALAEQGEGVGRVRRGRVQGRRDPWEELGKPAERSLSTHPELSSACKVVADLVFLTSC